MKKKIALMIIGAQKAGTTSLNRYLSQHPNIYTHNTIEFGMFSDAQAYNKGFEYYYKNTVSENVKSNKTKSIFVAKRVGLMCNRELLIKLRDHNPDVKLIIVLRNPIDRAFSAFLYCRNSGMEPYTKFEDAVFLNDPKRFNDNERIKKNCEYILRSNYLQHLKAVYSIFPSENIKLFLFEEMILDLNKYLNEICTFVNLEKYKFDVSTKYNETKVSRFQWIARMISPQKKSILKNIIPLKRRTKIKETLRIANQKKEYKDSKEIQHHTRLYLQNIFKRDIYELENFTRLPLKNYWQEFFKNSQ
jgi:hypothetical protein